MIEHVSYPADFSTLKNWNANDSPGESLYLELFGETAPNVDMNYARVLPGGSVSEAPANETLLSSYQYWWTVGLATEVCTSSHPLFSHDPVHVCLYFPTQGGWRIKEILPNVVYLKPVHEQLAGWHRLASESEELAPILSTFTGAASLSRLLGVAARASAIPPLEAASLLPLVMSIFAKMHLNTVPPTDGFAWFVEKTSYYHHEFGLMQGIEWTIPARMFHELGRRLTGSLTLTFLPSHGQAEQAKGKAPAFQRCPILAKAFLREKHHPVELPPGPGTFLPLYVKPELAQLA